MFELLARGEQRDKPVTDAAAHFGLSADIEPRVESEVHGFGAI